MTHVDTSVVIDLAREHARGVTGPATRLLEGLADEPVALSVFVVCELEVGILGSRDPQRERERVRAICEPMTVVFPDERFAATFGELFDRLGRNQRTVATMDLLIASAAIVDGAALATANRRHFDQIRGLRTIGY